ncbi:MAG: SRPBCC family protein, partial [Verrucomicrobia bacterium]|nr:SRPBCC family protein [Verrucomicrobiota bacterium]
MFPPKERQHPKFPSRGLCAALIAITGLSFFVGRADANAKDPAKPSTEVQWPAGYSPKTADIYSHDEVVIHASPSTVWRWLVAAEQWPTWYPNSHNVKILTAEKVLGPHSKFAWTTFGVPQESTVAKYIPNERLDYYSFHTDNSGTNDYHAWLLTPVADGCRVLSEAVHYGPNLSSYASEVNRAFRDWLNRLKAVC